MLRTPTTAFAEYCTTALFDSVPIPVQKAAAWIPKSVCNFTVLKCKLGTAGCRTQYVWGVSSINSFEPSSGSGHQLSYITVVHIEENQEWLRCQNHLAMEIFTCLFHSSPTSFKDSQGHSSRAQLHILPPFANTEARSTWLAPDAEVQPYPNTILCNNSD